MGIRRKNLRKKSFVWLILCLFFSLLPRMAYAQSYFNSASAGGVPVNADIFSSNKPAGTVGSASQKGQTIASGATDTILSIPSAAGYISSLMVADSGAALPDKVNLIVTVDGEGTPSINLPIEDACGDHYLYNQNSFFGRWLQGSNNGANGKTASCVIRLPMPFASSITVALRNNDANTVTVWSTILYHTGVPDTWNVTQRLHIVSSSTSGIAAYAEATLADVTTSTAARLVGVGWIYDSAPGSVSVVTSPLEGPFKMYQDGSVSPWYASSGSEDFFGENWYFVGIGTFGAGGGALGYGKTMAPPSSNVINTINSVATFAAIRIFVDDPITFNSEEKVTWTCGVNGIGFNFTGTCTMFGTVWYYTKN